MERRELIQWLVATAGLHGLTPRAIDLLAFGRDVHRRAASQSTGRRVLSAHAERTVAAAAERIIPATDTPGATDAGVSAFIDKMLADWYTPAERDRFLAGLPDLDTRCRTRRGRDFVDCAVADQVAVLTALDDGVKLERLAAMPRQSALVRHAQSSRCTATALPRSGCGHSTDSPPAATLAARPSKHEISVTQAAMQISTRSSSAGHDRRLGAKELTERPDHSRRGGRSRPSGTTSSTSRLGSCPSADWATPEP
jgi:hypothetical protein